MIKSVSKLKADNYLINYVENQHENNILIQIKLQIKQAFIYINL